MPITHIDNIVVYIQDQDHEHHARIARVIAHDWREYGNLFLELADGTDFAIPDGMMKGETSPGTRYYRFNGSTDGYDPEYNGKRFLDDRLDEGLDVDQMRRLVNDYHTLFGTSLTDDALSPRETSPR